MPSRIVILSTGIFILLIIKYVNEPLFRTGGRWTLRCSGLQDKKNVSWRTISGEVYKNNVNFTRLFPVVCHRNRIKYLLFERNSTDGWFCWIPSFCRSQSIRLSYTNNTLPHSTSVPIVTKCPVKFYKPNIFQTSQHNHFLCCFFNSTGLIIFVVLNSVLLNFLLNISHSFRLLIKSSASFHNSIYYFRLFLLCAKKI
jgi:hypothetical protein